MCVYICVCGLSAGQKADVDHEGDPNCLDLYIDIQTHIHLYISTTTSNHNTMHRNLLQQTNSRVR